MKNFTAIIIGGTGQFGLILSLLLLNKNFKIFITSRYKKKINILKKKYPHINFVKLNIYNKVRLKVLLKKINPDYIFYFAGQSSPKMSFAKKEQTMKSNYVGCKNVLKIICENNINTKFYNASSSEMYGHVKGKITLKTKKNPLNPYGLSKKKSFELVKKYRERFDLDASNLILFNTESHLRDKNFLISKICRAAILAHKNDKKTIINNIITKREWNWCEEQCRFIVKFLKKPPQDFIISNGKSYSIRQMLQYAFGYFNLDYKDFIIIRYKKLKKNEVRNKISDNQFSLKKNNIKLKHRIYGKKIIYKMINYYLQNKTY